MTLSRNDQRVLDLRAEHAANPCGSTLAGHTCTLGQHDPRVDHAEQVVPESCPAAAHTVAFWKDGDTDVR
jgi:hypothetical protein